MYNLYGKVGSEKRKEHFAAGTDRVAAMRGDLETPEEFFELGEKLAVVNSRKVEALAVLQNFSPDELDVKNPEHVQLANDAGYALAKEAYPNSYCLVVTHADSEGGHLHNHVLVLNHDNATGKAVRRNKMHHQLAGVNDRVMRDMGLQVTEKNRSVSQALYWQAKRGDKELKGHLVVLGDEIDQSLRDPRSVDEASFREVLAEKGIELEAKAYTIKASAAKGTDGQPVQPEHEAVGWTYKKRMALEDGGKERLRRAKASTLAEQFTAKGAEEFFAENAQRGLSKAAQPQRSRPSFEDQARAVAATSVEVPDIPLLMPGSRRRTVATAAHEAEQQEALARAQRETEQLAERFRAQGEAREAASAAPVPVVEPATEAEAAPEPVVPSQKAQQRPSGNEQRARIQASLDDLEETLREMGMGSPEHEEKAEEEPQAPEVRSEAPAPSRKAPAPDPSKPVSPVRKRALAAIARAHRAKETEGRAAGRSEGPSL